MWMEKIVEGNNGYRRVIYDKIKNQVVIDVEIFNTDFIKGIVENHNAALSDEYERGLREGIQIERENK